MKHKYLTMPTVMTSDALIKAAEDMSQAVKGVFPTTGPTQEAIEQLMRIFKEKARTEVDSATVQRVLRKEALSQRVHKEAEHAPEDAEIKLRAPPQRTTTQVVARISYHKMMIYLKKKVRVQHAGQDPGQYR